MLCCAFTFNGVTLFIDVNDGRDLTGLLDARACFAHADRLNRRKVVTVQREIGVKSN